jgi:hypothetical protein
MTSLSIVMQETCADVAFREAIMLIRDEDPLSVREYNVRPVEKHSEIRSIPINQRLKLVGTGLVLILVGALKISRGAQVSTHWTGQPLFSWGLVTSGAVCILLSLIPRSWIMKATEDPHTKHRSHH